MSTKKPSKKEVRSFRVSSSNLAVRSKSDGNGHTIEGLAIVAGSLSEDLGGFKEIITIDAIKSAITPESDIFLFHSHDSGRVLARSSAGTLRLTVDKAGLRFSADLPNTTDGNDLAVSLARGDIRSMSFGFSCEADDWQLAGNQLVRTVLAMTVYELSAVAMPAYADTSAALRGCPVELKHKLGRDSAKPNDEQSEEKRCECRCAPCVDGDCDECADIDCQDELCSECPAQSRTLHIELLLRRMNSYSL